MKRRFIETYISWNWKTQNSIILKEASELIRVIKKLGYSGFSLIYKITSFNEKIPSRLFKQIKEIGEAEKVEFVTRAEITISSVSLTKRILRRVRRQFELISMIPVNREQMVFACRDRRIDIVTILPMRIIRLYKGDFKNIREEGKVIELLVSPFRDLSIQELASALYNYSKLIDELIKKEIKLIISTGAERAEEIPDPYSKAAFLEVLGVKTDEALNATSTNITEIVERNRKKLCGKIPVRGVEVLGDIDT